MSRRPLLVAVSTAASAVLLGTSLVAPAFAADTRSKSAADRGVTYLATQQQPSGGFGQDTSTSGDFVGTETVDAVLALADASQPTLDYDAEKARAAVVARRSGGRNALDFLDELADGDRSAGKYGEIALASLAVGIDPRKFDPKGNGPVDLVQRIRSKRAPGGFFFSDLLVLKALGGAGEAIGSADVTRIRSAQRSDGGWNYSGDQTTGDFSGSDADVTGLVLEVLALTGASSSDDAISRGVSYLVSQQNTDGGFRTSFDPTSNPTTTRSAVLGLTAAGHDVAGGCWSNQKTTPVQYLLGTQEPSGRFGPAADFLPTQNTSAAIQALLRNVQPFRRAARATCPTRGYRLVAADGGVFTFGNASFAGSTGDLTLNKPIVASAATPSGHGYWLFASDGGVFAFGDALFYGSTGDLTLNKPIVGAAATPTGGGYSLFASDGGVFTFGDAAFFGSTGSITLNKPIVAAESTPSGKGYWLFASDGGVFAFGDATFEGSTGAITLNQPIVGGAASRGGKGYWLFASDGGVFAFGDASFEGSAGGEKLNKPIVNGFRSAGDGYYLVASDGGVFAFNAPFLGSQGANPLNSPVVSGSR